MTEESMYLCYARPDQASVKEDHPKRLGIYPQPF